MEVGGGWEVGEWRLVGGGRDYGMRDRFQGLWGWEVGRGWMGGRRMERE